jgi:hypothetical protein
MNNSDGPELRTTDGNATTNVGSGSSDSEQAHSAPDEGRLSHRCFGRPLHPHGHLFRRSNAAETLISDIQCLDLQRSHPEFPSDHMVGYSETDPVPTM